MKEKSLNPKRSNSILKNIRNTSHLNWEKNFIYLLNFQILCKKLIPFLIIVSSIIPIDSLLALDANEHFAKGNQYLANHQYSKAIIEYKQALKLNPYYKEAYLNLGKAYQAKRLFKDAIKQYKKAIELDKKYVDAYINLGLCYKEKNLLSKAKANLEKAIKLNPVNPEAYFHLGNVLYKDKKINESIEKYIHATKIDPKYFQAYIKLGSIYFKDFKDNEKAIYYFNKAKNVNPKDETSYVKLGELYFQNGFIDKAILEYKKALDLNPKSPTTLSQFGLLYLNTGNYKNALPLHEKLVTLVPNNPIAHYILGVNYEKLGMFQRALDEFETTLSLDVEDEVALFRQERIVLELDRARVSSVWRKKNSEKHLSNAEDYFKQGFLTLAIYEFKRSILLDPQNPNTRLSLAKLYDFIGEKQLAIEELTKVVELDPNNLEARDRLEKLYFEQETSLSYREKIDPNKIPKSEIKLVVCAYTTNPIHYEIETIASQMLLPLLKQFPHITLIDKTFIQSNEKNVIDIARNLGADLALWMNINENEEMIEITAQLIDVKTIKKISKTHLVTKGRHRLIRALSFLAEKVINSVPIEGVIMKIDDDKVIINLGKLHGIKPEQTLEIWKREVQLHPFGQRVKKGKSIGKIKVLAVEPNISKARIITPLTLKYIGVNDIVRLPVVKKKK